VYLTVSMLNADNSMGPYISTLKQVRAQSPPFVLTRVNTLLTLARVLAL
jgi:hypothetical protein